MNILVYLVIFLVFIVLFVVGVYNSGEIALDLVVGSVGPVPIGVVIASAFLFGVALTCVIGVMDGIKIRITNRQLRKQVRRLEEEVDGLRLGLARYEGPARPAPTASEIVAPEEPRPYG